MNLFLHTAARIRILNDAGEEWQGTPDDFAALESDYPGLSDGMIARYQTDEKQYETDGSAYYEDTVDALQYCADISSYPSWSPDSDEVIDDTITSTEYTWSSSKIAAEIAAGGGGDGALFPGEYRIVCCSLPSPLPDGWAEAGTAIDRSTPLGTQLVADGCPWGTGDGSTTVDLPPKEVFLLISGSTYALGTAGGESEHTLTASEMPAHDHPGVQRTYYITTGGVSNTTSTYKGLCKNSVSVTGSAGGGQAHNNMPPYAAVNVMIYTG